MKRLLSTILALMMLVLPGLSAAENVTIGTETVKNGASMLANVDPMMKYALEGQEVTADISMEISDLMLTNMRLPEDVTTAVKDIFSVLSFRVTGQTSGKMAQTGMAVLLGGEEAVNAKVAYGDKSIYATSNLLGDKILQFTPAQIKELAKKALDSMVAGGQITQEQLDSAKRLYRDFRKDPSATLQKLIGNPDLQPLMTAVAELSKGISTGEVTEAPEAFPQAASMMTLHLGKDALAKVTEELGRLLWSIPAIQKTAAVLKRGPQSEEEMIALCSKAPNKLAEDCDIHLYVDEAGTGLYLESSPKLITGDGTKELKISSLVGIRENGADVEYTLAANEMAIRGLMNITADGQNVNVTHHITSEAMQNGVTYQPVEEIISVSLTATENGRDAKMETTIRAKNSPDAAEVGVTMKMTLNSADLGDHAEENGVIVIGMEGYGDLMTMRVNAKTDLAEAYIITPDAIQPLAMSEEELNALWQEIQGNSLAVLFSSMSKLPASVLKLLPTTTGQ